ncbi:protein singed wings 2 [Musca domestica]|uniref:Protein singed wings 2 n=1 Tax=Musca domestica TaxID=7370 RepID=A0A9J7CYR1_MUSDO|nr:protein singed wings 2 [Musca domestica]
MPRNPYVIVFLAIVYSVTKLCYGDYQPHYQQHNISCLDWKQSPELVSGNCTKYKYGALRCFGNWKNLQSINDQKYRGRLEDIIFCGWPERDFNPVVDLQAFPRIKSLTIEYSRMAHIIDFPEMFHLQMINISWTNLSHIGQRTFKKIHPLRIVDLRWNKLIQLDTPLLLPRAFESLYLSGNPWNCTRNLKWLLIPERASYVADRQILTCGDRKFKDRNVMTVMHYKVTLKNACQSHEDLKNCSCIMHHIIPKTHMPLYTVNCSHLGFNRLPAYLPANTTMFFANNNKISDVSPLRNNIHYRYVVDVHLDNNRIESIDVLEGGYWLEHFRLLSLRNNKMRKIPVYALDNALEDNANANLLLLSMNPWHCSCKFAMRFREIVIKYGDIMRDSGNITCKYIQDGEEKKSRLMTLTREDVCKPKDESKIHILDWVNGLLAALILLILGKLGYDYYYYKNYGRVPWIVMKLP